MIYIFCFLGGVVVGELVTLAVLVIGRAAADRDKHGRRDQPVQSQDLQA